MAENLSIQDVRDRLRNPDRIKKESFPILQAICILHNEHPADQRVQELVLRALEQRDAFGENTAILDGLTRKMGLFPYLDPERLGLADAIAYEFHRPPNIKEDLIFHRVQEQVYLHLMDGENIILSAPTSFGKSLIIDALIASRNYHHIAIVVPTIALIDETRRRLSQRFSDTYKIITHPSQHRADWELLVMTQERILELHPLEPIDLFIIDEFYKLQPRQEDMQRSLVLNEAFYRLHKTGAQFYLLGPNIKEITRLPDKISYKFIQTDYKTVASEVHRIKPGDDDLATLVDLCNKLTEPTLIYCSSPARVRTVAEALLEGNSSEPIAALADAVEWVGKEYHPEWLYGRALAHGIGLHHGRLPRTLAQYVVRAFNEGHLRFLICTSTLIEGVNTKAKNVIVFDNKVALKKFDYFTYNNILGRSGRMFQHFIGHVYVFHAPPAENLPLIDFPVFTQPGDVPESLLVQIDKEDLGPDAQTRMAGLHKQEELDMELLRQNRSIDPQSQVSLAKELRQRADYYWPLLHWTGMPTWDQLYAACALIWQYLANDRGRSGVHSAKQLAFKIERFRQNRSVAALLRIELNQEDDRTPDIAIEETIEFLRNWANFSFPRYLQALDRIQNSVFTKLGKKPGNYSVFSGQIENWFLDPAVMALDEYGVPVQLGEQLQRVLNPEGDLDVALDKLRHLDVKQLRLTDFERTLLNDAIAHL